MTKVEELRDDLDELIETEATKVLTADQFLELPGFDGIVDAIVSAARAEGVVEGAEREREKWIRGNETDEENDKRGQTLEARLMGKPSVLAPTKEGEK